MSGLQPPPRININTQDVGGTHDLSESDDHFSSASEGEAPPTPITRVERVDDRPAHGEVPGTHAYSLRTQDAVPDEIEIVPEGQRSRSGTQSRSRAASNLSISSRPETPRSPGGTPVPRTVVERVDDKPAHGEVQGTYAAEQRRADAEPDEVRRAPPEARSGVINEEDDQAIDTDESRQAWFRSMWEGGQEQPPDADADADAENEDNDDFGDDFDEFNEAGGEDDDFGDFDEAGDGDGDGDGEATPMAAQPRTQLPTTTLPDVLAGLPPLDLSNLSPSETQESITPYITTIFPTAQPLPPLHTLPPIDPSKTSPFLSPRSLSLWQQLVSPPPLQPPNWTRSRIRRLFLVSLGVPVDLDEILPPSKQKRLILPTTNLTTSPRPSHALDRLKDPAANSSSTSLDSKSGQKRPSSSRRLAKGPPPPPDFDLNSARLLCATTVEALRGFIDEGLKAHVARLEVLNREASAVLEYWLVRRDELVREKEAFEGVIENLVGFVKGRRGGGAK
ncbi:hypothetical protein EJ03DRAFT_369131 [Teratosphaeria nubilosa]|uniref:Uncharacterized protein n=1 Tax=Teratosphaeria nubilosa TaxID=161662 RepID=A0A6G1KYI5_9PEZI|nr:hypothetical protein EJ03DRAFT_369131 [Teratosphaeria nubilosa]